MNKQVKQQNKKPSAHSLRQDILLGLLLLMCVPFVVLGYVIYRVDLPTYKAVIAKELSKQTGRKIELAGDIHWSIAMDHGMSLGITDISIGNPSWASRPRMAHIGSAKLHLDLWPLFKRQISIVAFNLDNVDMQLEKNKHGATNWFFKKLSTPSQKKQTTKTTAQANDTSSVAINIKKVSITNSRIGFLTGKKGVKIITIPQLTLHTNKHATRLHYKGTIAGLKAEMDLAGGSFQTIQSKKWPFNTSLTIDKIKFDGKGYLKDNIQQIILTPYLLKAEDSKIYGQMTVTLGGKRPFIRGTIKSADLDPDDFILPIKDPTPQNINDPIARHEHAMKTKGHLFSREAMDLSALHAIDFHFDVMLDKVAVGLTTISDLMSKLQLRNGVLTASSTKGQIAGSTARAALKLDSTKSKPSISFVLKANKMDMAHFVKLGEIESFIEGRADIDIELNTHGRSMHELAAHSNGHINMEMNTGAISKSTLSSIAGSLVDLFAPGVNALMDAGINCMAAQYTIEQGLLKTKGLLIDTAATTLAGSGYANLADERINMSLNTRPKVLGIGSIIPSVDIRGSLIDPSFMMDTDSTLDKVSGLLNGTSTVSNVPSLVKVSKGQNACVVTLKNPMAAKATPQQTSTPILSPNVTSSGGAGAKIKDTMNKLFKNFGKGLLGQ